LGVLVEIAPIRCRRDSRLVGLRISDSLRTTLAPNAIAARPRRALKRCPAASNRQTQRRKRQRRRQKPAATKRNGGVDESSTPLFSLIYSYLQPEQEAQQSAEGQQPACAAFAVPATPSATTAINKITFNVFIVFSLRSGKGCGWTDENIRTKNPCGLPSVSKCGERALEEEYLGPNAKESKGSRLQSRGENGTSRSSPTSTPQRKGGPA
jgi:hypothetical protein